MGKGLNGLVKLLRHDCLFACFLYYSILSFQLSYKVPTLVSHYIIVLIFFLILLFFSHCFKYTFIYKKITIEHSYYFISPYSNFSHKTRDVIFPTNTRDVCVLYGHGDQNVSPMTARDVSVSRSKN